MRRTCTALAAGWLTALLTGPSSPAAEPPGDRPLAAILAPPAFLQPAGAAGGAPAVPVTGRQPDSSPGLFDSYREAIFTPWDNNGRKVHGPTKINTNRPTFTPAAVAVGAGRVQLETGYRYTYDTTAGQVYQNHSYPQADLRIGLFTDWLELRVFQTFSNQQTWNGGLVSSSDGAQDTIISLRLDLTEQKGWLPTSSVYLQSAVPTGSPGLGAGQMLPQGILIYAWTVVPDFLSISGSSQANRQQDSFGTYYTQFAQSVLFSYTLTDKLTGFHEYFGTYPSGADAPQALPQHNFDVGFLYHVRDNIQLDGIVGMGLNQHANDFFAAGGISFRY